VTRSGLDTDFAKLKLRIVTDKGIELAADGYGTDFTVSALALRGVIGLDGRRGGRWQAFQRAVVAGEIWNFQLTNGNAGAVVPWLGFSLEVQ
jgi:hypothetical protein